MNCCMLLNSERTTYLLTRNSRVQQFRRDYGEPTHSPFHPDDICIYRVALRRSGLNAACSRLVNIDSLPGIYPSLLQDVYEEMVHHILIAPLLIEPISLKASVNIVIWKTSTSRPSSSLAVWKYPRYAYGKMWAVRGVRGTMVGLMTPHCLIE
jgi:hypothetical protein